MNAKAKQGKTEWPILLRAHGVAYSTASTRDLRMAKPCSKPYLTHTWRLP